MWNVGLNNFNMPKDDYSCHTSRGEAFHDSLYLLRVRFHTIAAANCAVEGDIGAFYLTFPAV